MKSLSPVVIFAYKRVEKFNQLISSLLKNKESSKTVLYIFLDGFKNIREKDKNLKIRDHILKIKGFKKIFFFHRKKNIGLAKNIILGINFVFKKGAMCKRCTSAPLVPISHKSSLVWLSVVPILGH